MKFGLIGRNISYSFSKKYFEQKFNRLSLPDYSYDLFDIQQIEEIEKIFSIDNLRGLNVTIPYKEQVIPFLDELSDEAEKRLEELAKNPKVLAIGEIGLDYHWMTRPKEEQFKIFRRQLELARRVNKPVVIHTREAMEDTINILNEYPDVKGILHCYPGSVESAKRMIDRFYLGIGGVLTFKNAKKLVDVVKEIPIENLVIETDCPYMAPTPYRGQRNEPIYTEEVAKKIAELKNMSYEDVVRITNENTRKVFKML